MEGGGKDSQSFGREREREREILGFLLLCWGRGLVNYRQIDAWVSEAFGHSWSLEQCWEFVVTQRKRNYYVHTYIQSFFSSLVVGGHGG